MWRWLGRLRSGRRPGAGEGALALEQQVQALRLDLEERDRRVAHLQLELDRQRRSEDARIRDAVAGHLRQLLAEAAAPAVQLLTQVHLVEVDGKPVPVQDVLTVARRLVHVLEEAGLTLTGHVGETVPFDANLHEPLRRDATLRAGQPVRVRFVGAAYRDQLLRRAGVDQAGG
jgi:molecular chaperone GrpE (heat shock protein)